MEELLEKMLGDIKHKQYTEALFDNGYEDGKPNKVVKYEDIRVIFNEYIDAWKRHKNEISHN